MAMAMTLLPLLGKAAATAGVVVVAARVAERAGPFLGGLVATLPVSAGPAYLFVALANDDAFVAGAALSSLATNAATLAFLTVLALACRHRPPVVAMAAALTVWAGAAATLQGAAWTVPAALALNAAAHGMCWWLTRRVALVPAVASAPVPRWYDMPLRAVLVAALVAGVGTSAAFIGPAATGVVAVFPIVLSCVAAIVHLRQGGAAAAAAMKGALLANPGFLLGLLAVHGLCGPIGRFGALAVGLAVMVLWSGALLVWRWSVTSRPVRC